MGSININYIKRAENTQRKFLYSDLHLDLDNDYKVKANFGKNTTNLIDIKIAYDIEAVKNSITALFSTNKGQRLLLPEYGINLNSLVFQPITPHTAYLIGELLKEGVKKWEPRVEVVMFNITPNEEDNMYEIDLEFNVPSLKQSGTLLGSILQGEGFARTG